MNDTTNTQSTQENKAEEAPASMAQRGEGRSRRPSSDAFRAFMVSGWGPRIQTEMKRSGAADYLPKRAEAAGEPFKGERLVIPAGTYKVRSNDCDYRFRAYSAFAHLSGLGGEREPDSVLVLEPREDGPHEPVLYFRPRASRSSQEFYSDATYGEFWVGARPSLEEVSAETGLRCEHIDTLRDALSKDAGLVNLRIVRGVDANIEAMVNEVRTQAGLKAGDDAREADEKFEERLSEIRLRKDPFEIAELQRAVDVTYQGFTDILKALPRAVGHHRGERVIEGAFGAVAREEGNGLGYDTIAASGNHANTLHWIWLTLVLRSIPSTLPTSPAHCRSTESSPRSRHVSTRLFWMRARPRLPEQTNLAPASRTFTTQQCKSLPLACASGVYFRSPLKNPYPLKVNNTVVGCLTAPATTWV